MKRARTEQEEWDDDENSEQEEEELVASDDERPAKKPRIEFQEDEEKDVAAPTLTAAQEAQILQQQTNTGAVQQEEKQPFTQQEIRALKETENLYSSSLFRLAFTEVLREVGVDWEKNQSFEICLRCFKKVVDEMKSEKTTIAAMLETPALQAVNTSGKKQVTFDKPTNVAVVGSYLLRSIAKPFENVDIAVTMPTTLVSDDGKYQYHVMRAAYLGFVKKQLAKHEMFSDISVKYHRNDESKPYLLIKPKKDEKLAPQFKKTSFEIRVMIAIDPSSKLQLGTDAYSHSIMEDMYMAQYLQMAHAVCKDCPALVETITLYKVWASKRGILHGHDTVNGFLFTMLLVYLLNNRNINKHMSPFQMLKIVMNWITNSPIEKGFTLSDSKDDVLVKKMAEEYAFALVDVEHKCNVFHRVSKQAWKELQHEASITLSYFEDERRSSAIEALFLKPQSFWSKFDAYIKFSRNPKSENKKEMNFATKMLQKMYNATLFAIGDRTKLIKLVLYDDYIVIGLLLTPTWGIPIIKGPSPLDKEKKKEFDDFWGEKSHMRKFKDGTLYMCAFWEYPGKHYIHVLTEMLRYVYSKHIYSTSVDCIGEYIFTNEFVPYDSFSTIHDKINSAFNELKESLLAADVNLQLESVFPAFAEYSRLAVYPVQENERLLKKGSKTKSHIHADSLHVVLEFQRDSRWPDGHEAIAKLKELMYISFKQQLSYPVIVNKHWMDVYVDGFAFRIVIRLDKELQIFKTTGHILDQRVVAIEKELFQVPLHVRWMHTIAGVFSSFPGTCRLAKKWVHSHMLSDHIYDELIELLVTFLYTSPYPYQAPNTEQVGFTRFIELLATHAWGDVPLFVNLEQESKTRVFEEKEFEQIALEYDALVTKPPVYVVASYNKQMRNFWTRSKPTKLVWNRIVALAKATQSTMQAMFESEEAANWSALFTPSLDEYDIVITFSVAALRHPERLGLQPSGTLQQVLTLTHNDVLVDFDPVDMYVHDIQQRLFNLGIIFRNRLLNQKVAILWNPKALEPSKFNPSKAACMMQKSGDLMVPNMAQIEAELKQFGQGMIESLVVQKK